MKKRISVLIVGFLFVGLNVYAGDGDLVVETGKVAIGTTSLTYKLDVRSDNEGTPTAAQLHIASTDTDAGAYIGSAGDGNAWFAGGGMYNGSGWTAKSTACGAYRVGAAGDLIFEATPSLTAGNTFTPTRRMTILGSNGYVGIGNSSPSYLLTMESSGGGYYNQISKTWVDGSSGRWKSSVTPITGALDTVLKLNGVSFKWKKRTDIFENSIDGTKVYVSSTWEDDPNGKDDIGLIGEHVAKVLPQVVDIDQKDPNFVSGVAYSKIVAVLIEAVKEQQKAIEDLQAQVKKLSGQ